MGTMKEKEIRAMTINDFNPDAMTIEELWQVWQQTNSVRPIRFAREMFPAKPVGYVRATRDLGCYVSNKATAMRCREVGQIETALQYERICDSIYDRLPEYARW